ncbi:acylneuraminate cytidylyltransferase family protein [uncultured Desulfobacter sp.]|uniref:acylneuraminate cytidylyltransferase family protein n=1 Tax=uncultured Desulfobacter sp. TaxID=240139 RepID=UPI002AAAE738|nr:acylneuraminate cytidylyltransferase family protein [uncultured Desulfobacter sp.]
MTARIAVIPARGGSKRLPRKNILPVLGRPMLHYPVKAALDSGCFDRVIVSTEDEEIRNIALGAGAEVMNRPDHLTRDQSTVAQVCLDVLARLSEHEEITSDWFCCIYATAIFITPEDICSALAMVEKDTRANCVMGVSDFNLQPLQSLEKDAEGFLKPRWQECMLQSQFHPQLVASNGTLYWVRTKDFVQQKSFYTDKMLGYKIPWIRAIDLDTPGDYDIACRIAPLLLGEIAPGRRQNADHY